MQCYLFNTIDFALLLPVEGKMFVRIIWSNSSNSSSDWEENRNQA